MRRTTPIVLAATALLLAGCGSQSGGDTGSKGKVSPSASAPSSGSGCAARLELKAAANGRTVCLAKGGELRISLDGTKTRPWKPVAASGTALRAINAGFVIQPGDASAAYKAVAAGTVKLTSSRPLCPAPDPGQVSCKGIQEWTVTVNVR
ncbi:hypothetical protein J2Z21_007429 [Streptomyces griseochromogenes]|uniref:Proteinase inhibitor I42 chagasin domain-containing protein n=1 Tax=Streptomyces griseochromogenes TaxID=68214 RepID=A0A1B1B976_9ACTN|nr:hypothetical protein [Streptomyces griseochromogenes]ANP55347.1 hypothetical protein AVL59_42280 [Streptomyces griseochromogenes]MBP2054424.1 hypothetical protein [Streptomyces griseochromogenes]